MSTTTTFEVRCSKGLRAIAREDQSQAMVIEGFAAKYNNPAVIGQGRDSFVEVLERGCFDRVLRERQDVVMLMNHDPNHIYGRTGNGTLELSSVDSVGLRFRCALPDSQSGRDAYASILRQDINGCSFSFICAKDGDEWSETQSDGLWLGLRRIKEISQLRDTSFVVWPAYSKTQVSAAEVSSLDNPADPEYDPSCDPQADEFDPESCPDSESNSLVVLAETRSIAARFRQQLAGRNKGVHRMSPEEWTREAKIRLLSSLHSAGEHALARKLANEGVFDL